MSRYQRNALRQENNAWCDIMVAATCDVACCWTALVAVLLSSYGYGGIRGRGRQPPLRDQPASLFEVLLGVLEFVQQWPFFTVHPTSTGIITPGRCILWGNKCVEQTIVKAVTRNLFDLVLGPGQSYSIV